MSVNEPSRTRSVASIQALNALPKIQIDQPAPDNLKRGGVMPHVMTPRTRDRVAAIEASKPEVSRPKTQRELDAEDWASYEAYIKKRNADSDARHRTS